MVTLVIFPRRVGETKAGDYSAPGELASVIKVLGHVLPIVRDKPVTELVKVTSEMRSFNAYAKLRVERANKRPLGVRLKRAAKAR